MAKLYSHDTEGTFSDTVIRAAGRAEIEPHAMLDYLTFWFEELSIEICKGHCVPITGFGMFGPYPITPVGKPAFCLPRFVPAIGFRSDVKLEAPPREKNRKKFCVFRANHAFRNGKRPRHVGSAMKYVRNYGNADAKRKGFR